MEVLALPETVDEELLCLYFENKRSGGGPLVSLEKRGDRAILVFEDAAGKWKHNIIVRGQICICSLLDFDFSFKNLHALHLTC